MKDIKMKDWIKKNILQSATMWIFALLVIISTVALFIGKVSGDAWLVALNVFAGIALAKRAYTQKTTGGT